MYFSSNSVGRLEKREYECNFLRSVISSKRWWSAMKLQNGEITAEEYSKRMKELDEEFKEEVDKIFEETRLKIEFYE